MGIRNRASGIVHATAGYFVDSIIFLIFLNAVLGVIFFCKDTYWARYAEPIFRHFPTLREKIGWYYTTDGAETIRLVRERVYPSMTEEEVAQLLDESFGRQWQPQWFTVFGEAPYHGKYVNVSEYGFRMGANQASWPPVHNGNFVVFIFGGSTTFGVGVPDAQTLASQLQPLLTKKLGKPVALYNFGQEANFSTQERIRFESLIQSGQRPDLVIFVDGLNDFHSPMEELPFSPASPPSFPQPPSWKSFLREGISLLPMTRLAIATHSALKKVARVNSSSQNVAENGKYEDRQVLENAIDRYLANKRLIEGEAAQYSIRTLFVWQPVPSYEFDEKNNPFIPPDRGLVDFTYSQYGYPMMREAMAKNWPSNFIWCADIQKDSHDVLYVDPVHYSPIMNGMVASCIADGVK